MNEPFRLSVTCVILFGVSSAVLAQEKVATLEVFPNSCEINGLHEGRQLLVTITGSEQKSRDATREASYSVEPANVVRVSTQGYVRPIGKGTAVIRIEIG